MMHLPAAIPVGDATRVAEARRVAGGLYNEWSELRGCSAGNPCTSTCRTETNCGCTG